MPSCRVHTRGPPEAGSAVKRPSMRPLLPRFKYWLQVSACLPQADTRNQTVSLTRCPSDAVNCRLVATEKFVTALKASQAKVLGLSALLTTTYPAMKTAVETLKEAGIRDQVSVIIGGAPCNEQVRVFSGADYYSKDAVAGVNICKEIYGV